MTEAARACCVCPQLRPQSTVRFYEQPQVCNGCRLRLGTILSELDAAHLELKDLARASVLGRIGITVDRSADYSRLAAWRTQDPGERARALRVEKPPQVPDAQLGLFD